MFDIAPVQHGDEGKLQVDDFLRDRTPVCEPYIFAGVPQNPFNAAHPEINVGSMLFTPSLRMHQCFLQNYLKTDHYGEDEEGKPKIVHEKIWVAGEGSMKTEWEKV